MADYGFVELVHPDFEEAKLDWTMMRDCLHGDRQIKEKGEFYLPMPDGFRNDASKTKSFYDAYKMRAKFPPLVAPVLRGMAGILNRVEPKVELPKALEGMIEKTTRTGDSMEIVYRRIVHDLLCTGRVALLTDMPEKASGDDLPYLAFYEAERLINWSREQDFYVLDETRLVRNGFSWWPIKKYRVLEIDPETGLYQVRIFDYLGGGEEYNEGSPTLPLQRGGERFTKIPLVVFGALDLAVEPSEVPLLGVAQAALAGYRLDADYRHQLYMSGQETFVITGIPKEDTPSMLGASVILTLPAESKAEYVGPSCRGIDAHRIAMADEVEAAAVAGARMFMNAQKGRTSESGDALKLRFSAETASLTSIAQSAAQGLERALKSAAQFMGIDPDEVIVTPNLSLVDATLSAADAVALTQLWIQGAISKQTLYDNLQKGEIASQERTLEEEQALIDDETPPPTRPNPAGVQGVMPRGSLNNPPTNQQIAQYRAAQASGASPPNTGQPNTGQPGGY